MPPSSSARCEGKTPSSQPARKTVSNSRPLAAWMVMIVTLSASRVGVIVHDQADMLEEGAERLVFLHRAGQLGEVLEAAGAFGRAVGLEHRGVAGFVEHQPGELGMRQLVEPARASGRNRRPDCRARGAPAPVSSSLSRIRAAASGRAARPAARASAWILATALSPRPRLGMLTIRSKARSSAGWAMTRR